MQLYPWATKVNSAGFVDRYKQAQFLQKVCCSHNHRPPQRFSHQSLQYLLLRLDNTVPAATVAAVVPDRPLLTTATTLSSHRHYVYYHHTCLHLHYYRYHHHHHHVTSPYYSIKRCGCGILLRWRQG